MAKIKNDMIIADILRMDVGLADILMRNGMRCVGCPSAQGETIGEAYDWVDIEVHNGGQPLYYYLISLE